jgi:hypothetical protein
VGGGGTVGGTRGTTGVGAGVVVGATAISHFPLRLLLAAAWPPGFSLKNPLISEYIC